MKKELNINIGKRIRAAREHTGLTREELAERIDVTPRFVADVERGSVGISVPTLIAICEVLHISSDSLLWGQTTSTGIDERLKLIDAAYIPFIEKSVQTQLELIDAITEKDR